MKSTELDEIIGSLDNYQGVRDYSNIFKEYYNTFIDYTPNENNDKVIVMLKRRLFLPLNFSDNASGVLIVGANPSYTGNDDGTDENFMKTSDELYSSDDKHWKEISEIAVNPKSLYKAAYLDLFPIKQTNLGEFEKVFRPINDVRAKMLRITHKRMLAIQPKVIINLFAMTSYYWGFKADGADYCDEKNPWMGYKFKKIEAEGLDAYEIIGWTESCQSILAHDKNERLPIGTFIIFSTKVWNKQAREEKMINKEKLQVFLQEHNISF